MNLPNDDRELIHKAFKTFFHKANGKFIIFDLETNGLQGSEVLSISAQKCQVMRNKQIQVLDHYDRYYFPTKKYNWQAIKVNGLNEKALIKKRAGCNYPEHFLDDLDAFIDWVGDVECFVGHNLKFDMSFFPEEVKFPRVFDTMIVNKEICKLPSTYGYKMPKLVEAASFYEVDTDQGTLHTSSFDVDVTRRVFEVMYSTM